MPAALFPTLEAAVAEIRQRLPGDWRVAAPLGLGKPHRLLNALYRSALADPDRRLQILTALSLTPPRPGSELERRFLEPFLARHFGDDFPVLDYARAQRSGSLPERIRVEEFYLQSGALLGKPLAQRHHVSLNYTHVARAVARRQANLLVQMVAREPGGSRLSMSCNPDLTLDVLDEFGHRGFPRPLLVAEVHPELPFLGGSAAVPADFYDLIVDLPGPAHQLFALPRGPVSLAEHAIGLYASTLVRDGGTLQIGIGALSDALTHALLLRHRRNADWRAMLAALWPGYADAPVLRQSGGLEPFRAGLYGASEMVMDGFQHLIEAGIVRRLVVDDLELMRRDAQGRLTESDRLRLASEGRFLHGGFWLGSKDFLAWLRQLPPETERRIGMTRISHINELYGGQEMLERLQRRHPRFFNTCMMMSLFGAATSDALESGQVVSGIGGQYNFVAMAHALVDSRSVLMLRATREAGGALASNIVYAHGHVSIPRHLRDVAISEYGIADLRDQTDEDTVRAMLSICDRRFAPGLAAQAKARGKLAGSAVDPGSWADNDAGALATKLAPFRRAGLLPEYPLGSDFTAVEQRLVRALGWLKGATASRGGKLRTLAAALVRQPPIDSEALARLGLERPRGASQHLLARLVSLALQRTDG